MISRSRVAVLAGALLLPVIALGIWREIVTQDDTRNKFGLMLGSVDIHRSAIIVAAMFQVAS